MDIKKYTCNICTKEYKTYKSMWNHKNKYHKNNNINDQKMTIPEAENDHLMTNNDHLLKNIDEMKEDNTICKYCNKKLSAYTHLRRHLKTCKKKDDIEKENENLKDKMLKMEKSLDELKKIMLSTMNKKYKMHPKTLQKMINNTNSNNIINNNMTINNNIQYVELGDEELHKVFTKREKLNILCGLGSPIDKIIKHTHLNDDYPQFQTIIITNVKSNLAYTFNKMLKKYILMDKTEILENLIGYRFDDLQQFYDECKNKIDPEQRECLEKLFMLKYDDKYYTNKSKEFNVIIYNECNKDNIKHKTIEDNDSEIDINEIA